MSGVPISLKLVPIAADVLSWEQHITIHQGGGGVIEHGHKLTELNIRDGGFPYKMGEQFYLKCWFLSDIFNLNLKGVIYAILYEFNRAVHFNVKAEPWAALHAKTFFSDVIGSSGLIRSSLPSFGGFFSVPGSGVGMANSYPKKPHAQSAQYDADPGSLLPGNRGARSERGRVG